jgi:hypothetical protein
MRFTAEDSRKILAILIATRRVTANQAQAALKTFDRTVSELRTQLATLEGETFPAPRGGARRRATRRSKASPQQAAARHPRRISPQREKTMRDQGRYLTAIRPLSKADRVKIKKIRADHGLPTAFEEARRLAKVR